MLFNEQKKIIKIFSYLFFVALHDENKKIRKKVCRVAFALEAP